VSATGRSDVRRDGDFYATPIGVTRAIAPRIARRSFILDPCAGEGAIFDGLGMPTTQAVGLELDPGRAATARAKGYAVEVVDALDRDLLWPSSSVVVTNPPYTLAEPFIWRALGHVGEAGTVAMLLRLNFLAGKKRGHLWATHRKPDVFVLDRRPSFAASVSCARGSVSEESGNVVVVTPVDPCGWRVMLESKAPRPKRCPACGAKVKVSTSDATEYAWFVWAPWATGAWHVLSWENAS
jgi:hypothetical protein